MRKCNQPYVRMHEFTDCRRSVYFFITKTLTHSAPSYFGTDTYTDTENINFSHKKAGVH